MEQQSIIAIIKSLLKNIDRNQDDGFLSKFDAIWHFRDMTQSGVDKLDQNNWEIIIEGLLEEVELSGDYCDKYIHEFLKIFISNMYASKNEYSIIAKCFRLSPNKKYSDDLITELYGLSMIDLLQSYPHQSKMPNSQTTKNYQVKVTWSSFHNGHYDPDHQCIFNEKKSPKENMMSYIRRRFFDPKPSYCNLEFIMKYLQDGVCTVICTDLKSPSHIIRGKFTFHK
jgi:hypothetical protein